jgi:hypothetical protein
VPKRFLLSAALSVILLSSAVRARAASPFEAATLRLELGMTEQMTTSIVGVEPTSSRMQTCGQDAGVRPYPCKLVIYGRLGSSSLGAFFQQTRRGWLLIGWAAF